MSVKLGWAWTRVASISCRCGRAFARRDRNANPIIGPLTRCIPQLDKFSSGARRGMHAPSWASETRKAPCWLILYFPIKPEFKATDASSCLCIFIYLNGFLFCIPLKNCLHSSSTISNESWNWVPWYFSCNTHSK